MPEILRSRERNQWAENYGMQEETETRLQNHEFCMVSAQVFPVKIVLLQLLLALVKGKPLLIVCLYIVNRTECLVSSTGLQPSSFKSKLTKVIALLLNGHSTSSGGVL